MDIEIFAVIENQKFRKILMWIGKISRIYTVIFIFLNVIVFSSCGLFQFKRYSYRKKSGNVSVYISALILYSIYNVFNVCCLLFLTKEITFCHCLFSFRGCLHEASQPGYLSQPGFRARSCLYYLLLIFILHLYVGTELTCLD